MKARTLFSVAWSEPDSEVAHNDTRGHGQFKATRPERKEKKGVALLP
jgi:hypothetical protein